MFKCGFYEREITPPLGCHLSGYGNIRPAVDVKDRLYARAFVVSDGKETVAMIAIDALRTHRKIRDAIAARVSEFTGISEENVLVAATHSHTGIPDPDFDTHPEMGERQKYYFNVFADIIADCAILAYKRMQESKMTFGIGNVEGISFCRDYIMKNSTPLTNPGRLNPDIIGPASETDNELPVLFVKSAKGENLGAIISFACHLDCVGGYEFSGDFASELSKQMKKVYGEDFVTVFFMGTAGDINHINVNVAEIASDHYRLMGRKIAGEAIKTVAFAEPVEGDKIICRFRTIQIPRREVTEEQYAKAKYIAETLEVDPDAKLEADGGKSNAYHLMMARKLLSVMAEVPVISDVPLHYIKIGELELFGFPSEVYCYFGRDVKAKCGNDKRIVISYCNGLFGYIPTRELFYDTIYESAPGSNRLCSDAGYMMVDTLLEMREE